VTPGETAAFAFVGMAGLTAATMHAPVTAIVLVFELTGHYELTLPVMLCSIVASISASMIDRDSYYTAAMRAKGDDLPAGLEDLAIRTMFVRDVVRKDCLRVRHNADFNEVMTLLQTHRGDTIYVTDDDDKLIGRIELQDVKAFLNDPGLTTVVIAADLTRPAISVPDDLSIAAVMPQFENPELRELAVVAPGSGKMLGHIRHQDVLRTLGNEVLGQQRPSLRLPVRGLDGELELPAGYAMRSVKAPPHWIGLAVDALPSSARRDVVVVLVVRRDDDEEHVLAATQDLVVQERDRVVVLGTRAAVRTLQAAAEED